MIIYRSDNNLLFNQVRTSTCMPGKMRSYMAEKHMQRSLPAILPQSSGIPLPITAEKCSGTMMKRTTVFCMMLTAAAYSGTGERKKLDLHASAWRMSQLPIYNRKANIR